MKFLGNVAIFAHNQLMKTLLLFEATVYAVTGLWPIIHYSSFEKITGPKADVWLVIVVGWFITICSAAMFSSYFGNISREGLVIALGTPVILGTLDVYYVLKKEISKVYLIDAVLEFFFAVCWLFLLL